MNPLNRWLPRCLWDTPEYWAKDRAARGLKLAREVARKDRPRRKSDRKRAKLSQRRNK